MLLSQKQQELLDALKEKRGALETILEITELQEGLFDQEDDVMSLMDNIELRQQWIDYVDRMDELVNTLKVTTRDFPEIKREQEAIQSALGKISRQDAVNERKALSKITEYKQALKAVKAEKAGFNGYVANDIPVDGAYFDEKQ